jgi:FKBP-type peptidyl-prolyl cis-trans isomerase 2
MVTVSYQVTVVGDATLFASTNGLEKTELENLLEGQHEFEFELGAGAVIAPFEECVRHAHVGQTLCFQVPAQPIDLLLASNKNIKYPTHS